MLKLIFVYICILFVLSNCSNKTSFSGKILHKNELENLNFVNKEKLINSLGTPSFIDPIENKFFYFTEKSEKKSIFKKEVKYSYVFIFELNKKDEIINTKVYDIKNIENIKFSNDSTSNEIVKRGLIEKIFGGVGTQQQLPTSP